MVMMTMMVMVMVMTVLGFARSTLCTCGQTRRLHHDDDDDCVGSGGGGGEEEEDDDDGDDDDDYDDLQRQKDKDIQRVEQRQTERSRKIDMSTRERGGGPEG